MTGPLISILTPSFNQGKYLTDAIQSIARQGYSKFEHIVVDGGSTDNTLDVLKECQENYPLEWITEPDHGLYDALNKAINISRGEWIGWLNCDDIYPQGTFDRFLSALHAKPEVAVVCGDAEIFSQQDNGENETIATSRHYRGDRFEATSQNLKATHLNCCFIRRSLIDEVGTFDANYRIVGDRDYMFRIMRLAPSSVHVGEVTCLYRSHSTSLTMAVTEEGGKGGIRIKRNHPQWSEIFRLCEQHREVSSNPAQIQEWCRSNLAVLYSNWAANYLLDGDLNEFTRCTKKGINTRTGLWFNHFIRSLIRQILERVGVLHR